MVSGAPLAKMYVPESLLSLVALTVAITDIRLRDTIASTQNEQASKRSGGASNHSEAETQNICYATHRNAESK